METATPSRPSAGGPVVVSSLAEALALNEERKAMGLPPLGVVNLDLVEEEAKIMHGDPDTGKPAGILPSQRQLLASLAALGALADGPRGVTKSRGGRPSSTPNAEVVSRFVPSLLQVIPSAAGRNDQCPCGSGLKYKKCHRGKPLPPRRA